MSKDNKQLKIWCIATIAVGLVALFIGIVALISGGIDTSAILTTMVGGLGTAFGVWAARAANVPSNATSIARWAIAMLVLSFAADLILVIPDLTVGKDNVAGLAGNTALLVTTFLARAYAVRVEREQERR